MGTGQVGGIATLLDIDFDNAAHFLGQTADVTEGQFIVYYMSHALLFCAGALIEAHVVVTPAVCVFGERYKFDVYGGSHMFVENAGVTRQVHHLCMHKGYNHTSRMRGACSPDNISLLVLNKQFSFHALEPGADFIVNRLRYGIPTSKKLRESDTTCKYFGWGSRRNGYLVPLLLRLRRMEVTIMPSEKCPDMFNNKGGYLCIYPQNCKSNKYGALCPDDVGSVITCSGYAHGMMVSRLVDRPCGIGFIDLTLYNKFLTCGVDDSRDVIDHDEHIDVEFIPRTTHEFTTLRSTTLADEELIIT